MDLNISVVLLCGMLATSAGTGTSETDVMNSETKNNVVDANLNANLNNEGPEAGGKLADILERMKQLEIREKTRETMYVRELDKLRRQLAVQTKRTTSLERLVKHLYNGMSDTSHGNTDKESDVPNNSDINVKHSSIQSHKMMKTQRIRRAENESPVAFFATLNNHLNHLSANQPIAFDNVVTNIGNAYNNHFGSFIAPVPGTYVFSATLFSHYHTNYHANFVKNGQMITRMYVSGGEGGYDTTSQTIVLDLVKGDDVGIQNIDADKPIYGFNYSMFSGFLLQENFQSSVVVG
ncbi:heavy metal-binding protein HIP-like [Ruditapes philippinarum]|uniref:heavy metal-binding protein HIP-like n=1 Tax=Ruditapes philippinarum TaxID=129788 RepID=UPI00295C03B0|nr:heavy metal-binding protein HIP-like [Ruditapes philippinarum]